MRQLSALLLTADHTSSVTRTRSCCSFWVCTLVCRFSKVSRILRVHKIRNKAKARYPCLQPDEFQYLFYVIYFTAARLVTKLQVNDVSSKYSSRDEVKHG